MKKFSIQIAGSCYGICSHFETTSAYFKNYISQETPILQIEATNDAMREEQRILDEEADKEHLKRRQFTDPFLERAVIQRRIAEAAVIQGILLLHGSTISVDGTGYIFTAKTGTGKSTHTRFWRNAFGERAVMVNDDRAFLDLNSTVVSAFGSPWSGKHGLDSNICVPLNGICILERGAENRIRRISAEDALQELLQQAFFPTEAQYSLVTELTNRLAKAVPIWRMTCTKDQESAYIAYAAMKR